MPLSFIVSDCFLFVVACFPGFRLLMERWESVMPNLRVMNAAVCSVSRMQPRCCGGPVRCVGS